MSESRQVRFRLGTAVLGVLDAEAARMALDSPGFLRALIRRASSDFPLERPIDAQDYEPIGAEAPKEDFVVLLDPALESALRGTCARLGGGSPSTVASHWILDWVGISPLARSAIIEVAGAGNARRPTGRRRTGSQPTKSQLLTLGKPVLDLLEAEAGRMGIRYSELIRNLLRAKMGVAQFGRPDSAPRYDALDPQAELVRVKRSVLLPLDLIELLQRMSIRLGGGEKSTIVAHLILDWLGLSPLA